LFPRLSKEVRDPRLRVGRRHEGGGVHASRHELAFAKNVKYESRWIWTRTIRKKIGIFAKRDRDIDHRHHDAIEFPDGNYVMVNQLIEGQRVTVLQLPATGKPSRLPEDTQIDYEGDDLPPDQLAEIEAVLAREPRERTRIRRFPPDA